MLPSLGLATGGMRSTFLFGMVASYERSNMVVLVTGFEPFGGEIENPSWLVAQELERLFCGSGADVIPSACSDATPCLNETALAPAYATERATARELQVVAKQLPVVFGACGQAITKAMRDLHPDVVVCLGQAGGRRQLTPEFVGINWRSARIPDNAGNQPTGEKIMSSALDAYFSTLPVQKMVEAACGAGVPAALSYTAGTYCCNETLYTALHVAATEMPQVKCGFVHVPYANSQVIQGHKDAPSMSLANMVEGLAAMLCCLAADASH